MKALVYELNEKLSIQERSKPVPKPGEALIKVKLAGICGSDIIAWKGGFTRIVNPVILGHEFAGIVEAINPNGPTSINPGDRVAVEPLLACGKCEACRKGYYNVCRKLGLLGLDRDGGFTSYVCAPLERLHLIPDTVSMERAVFAEPLAVALHMVRRSRLAFGQSVAVFGAGPIGVLVAMVARESGASTIAISDINEHRLQRVRDLGFSAVDARTDDATDYMKSLFGEEGADISFELAASPQALEAAIKVAKVRGVVVAGGMFKKPPVIDLQQVTMKEQLVVGTRTYTFEDFEAAIRLLNRPDLPVEALISKEVHVEEAIEQGFYAIKNGEDLMKVLIRFND